MSLVTEASQVLVGAAKLELTPPVKTPLAGYSRRRGRLMTGVHDPVYVRALVIQNGQDGTPTAALVSCDLLIIDEVLADAVSRRLKATTRLGPLTLLVAATHTHSGPGAYGRHFLEQLSMGHFEPAVLEFLTVRICEAIAAAADALKPAAVVDAGTATTGLVVNRMDAAGAVDPELGVVAYQASDGHPLAVVANFSAHPTTLGAWNRQMSADYPGVLTEAIEARYPGAVCLFFAGAVGDQAPVKRGEGFERAEWFGHELARSAQALLEQSVQPQPIQSVAVDQRVMRLPPAHLRLGSLQLPSWMSQPLVDDDATLTVLRIGPVCFIGVPCDLSAELGLELKAHARALGLHPLVIGFANDYIGYCLPERLYQTRRYEASMAFNGPKTGTLIVEELKRMIDHLVSSE
ncbi:MAG: neutral/alkaline non-lysosomal ceramidase N-terminal domain-containing protein [Candidatus Omnitrophica bacterium]|nr:neutral/alkaline non-lysosomal ceramidase N-terminal domain-containing protein [Candidatus Omnitrophota bacterium]